MRILLLLLFSTLFAATAFAQRDIVAVAQSSEDHKTLVSAVQAADLVQTLQGQGPFTVFAPTDKAFGKLPQEALASLLKPENKSQLSKVLTYHVLSGRFSAGDVLEAIRKNNNRATFTTVQGGTLAATIRDDAVFFIDEQGNESKLLMTDLKASNGTVHVIDTVLLPNM